VQDRVEKSDTCGKRIIRINLFIASFHSCSLQGRRNVRVRREMCKEMQAGRSQPTGSPDAWCQERSYALYALKYCHELCSCRFSGLRTCARRGRRSGSP